MNSSVLFLSSILESSADGILVVDVNGQITFTNKSFLNKWMIQNLNLQNRDSVKLIEAMMAQLKEPEFFAAIIKELDVLTESTSSNVLELIDGRVFRCLSNPQTIEGRRMGRVWIFRDITLQSHEVAKRKIALEKLREVREGLEKRVHLRTAELSSANAFLDSLIENIPDMIFVKEAESLNFVRFNKAGEELLGYSRRELIGKNDFDIFPEGDAAEMTKVDRDVLNSRRQLDIPEETIRTRKNGIRTLHTKKIPIYGPSGEHQYLLGISQDITEKKRTEEMTIKLFREQATRVEIQASNDRAKFLADCGTILAGSIDYEETIKTVACQAVPRFANWFLTAMSDDNRNLRILHLVTDSSKSDIANRIRSYQPEMGAPDGIAKVFRTGEPVLCSTVADEPLFSYSEHWSPLSTRDPVQARLIQEIGLKSYMIVPLAVRNEVLGVMFIASNDVERRYTESDLTFAKDIAFKCALAIENTLLYKKAELGLQLRDEFLAVASHELKTPLTSLMMQTQLIKRAFDKSDLMGSSKKKFSKLLENSQAQLEIFSSLISNLLDVSKMSGGKVELFRSEVNFSNIVTNVVSNMGPDFRRSGCTVHVHANESILGELDSVQIEKMVAHLIANAVKYGSGKRVEIETFSDGLNAVLRIRDYGIGIHVEDQTRIFRRFERAVSLKQFSGFGLGLFLVREIVDAHQGVVKVDSEIGKGSTFMVKLPLRTR